jgi:hypothetical protein
MIFIDLKSFYSYCLSFHTTISIVPSQSHKLCFIILFNIDTGHTIKTATHENLSNFSFDDKDLVCDSTAQNKGDNCHC